MAEKKKEDKTVFEEEFKCPHCKKYIDIKKTRKQISEPVQAEYEEKLVVTKSDQTRLKE